ncbi:hypothetical protein HHK36_010822 [Tetracentron sinense]|uniref:Uncharacterized protein n=1 Tax=Tetracentron sinense TaxID=13715 RepID=A0A835DGN7_TETSI|nr:hypothetical protein HHK36_010822 [Tetracentron sinense]
MGKQMKAKKPENLGKGKVTPVQVAFIVDRYLSDNNYTQTRSIFRTEASILISKTNVQEAPKSLLSLEAILNEYICLKEQKVMLEQDKSRVEQEKCRVEALLRGMQDAMNSYNSTGSISPPSMAAVGTNSTVLIPQSDPSIGCTPGYPMYNSPIMNTIPKLSNNVMDQTNFSTPMINYPSKNKRKSLRLVPDATPTAKRSCSQIPTMQSPIGGTNTPSKTINTSSTQEAVQKFSGIQSSLHNRLSNGSLVQGSIVAKNLLKQPSQSPPINSPGPKTPPQALPSPSDKSVSPSESSSLVSSTEKSTSPEIAPTNCPVISSETVTVSPFKHVTYYSMEKNHYISSPPSKNMKRLGKRDYVKGRLDFDGSDAPMSSEKPMTVDISTSEPNKEAEIFDMDMLNFDIFCADFSLSELLLDTDFDCEGISFSCQPDFEPSTDFNSGSQHESGGGSLEVNQVWSELSSTVTEVLSEKDTNIQGPDSLKSVKSITKCIRILSPAKIQRSSLLDQENRSARD